MRGTACWQVRGFTTFWRASSSFIVLACTISGLNSGCDHTVVTHRADTAAPLPGL
jgi:hypothetical protein